MSTVLEAISVRPPSDVTSYTKKDFSSDQTIRWCPGCGDYSILSQVQKFVVISGIGCSGRFPYYMETYGFHTIHGRAPAFATGLKATRPDLQIWVISGDGDSLSIGGNHLIHAMRRNVDIKLLMFNNRIYGLTKGQYSPTSEVGKRTKSTPMGSIDAPFNPPALALGAGATLVARSIDVIPAHLRATVERAHEHVGMAYVEIYQNCNIFNDGAFAEYTDKGARDDRILELRHGEPLVWGKSQRKGLVLDRLRLKVVTLGDGYEESDCLVHDETDPILAEMLVRLDSPAFPLPIGVFYREQRPTYDSAFQAQVAQARKTLGNGDLEKLVNAGDTWRIE
jgi:2-oxoglutarate/2-oxoacid ferredoxin oxidoreductase subunit beta